MKLSEKITKRRTDRLNEWSMDELSRDVAVLEKRIEELELALQWVRTDIGNKALKSALSKITQALN